MEKRNVKDENGENLVIVIKLELEHEETRNDDETNEVLYEVLYTEEERSETQIEKTDKQRDTSLENESIVDLFGDAFKDIPNPESSQKATEQPVLAERERKKELRLIGSEQSLDNDEDENSEPGTTFNYVPNLSTTPQVTEPKTAGIEAGNGRGEENWNETIGISGKETLTNKCQKCLKDFANKTFLLLHIDDKHPEVRNPRPLPCTFCDDIFTIKRRLVSHIKNVHGKSYGLRLREREITDRDENGGVCRWCGKEYKREKALRNHERLHTGETPYNCKLCGNSFELKARLDAHVRSRHKVTVLDEPDVPEEMSISEKNSENYVKNVNGNLNNGSSFKMEANNQDRQRRETGEVENVTTDYLKIEDVLIDGDDCTNIVEKSTAVVKLRSYAGVQNVKDEPSYICDYEGCKEAFKTYPALKAHLKNHTGERPFCCYHEDCEKSFTTNFKLKVHERIHKKDLPFACDWEGCGKKFTLSAHCKRHFMTHTGEKPHVCNACQKRFSRSDHLKQHVTRFVSKSVVKKVEKSRKDRQKRNENVITENLTRKRNTKKSSSNIGDLKLRLGHVASKVSCRCTHCQKPESINGHGNHVCDYEDCSKSFKREKELKSHLRRWHKEQLFVCCFESCSEKFGNYTKLRIHFVTHIGDPPYVCNYEECGKSFQIYPALKDHMKKHTGNRPRSHSCCREGCGKSFATNQQLTAHMRTHTGEKPHICNKCNKGFSQAHHLKNHLRTHTGEKPYVCKKCNKGFSRTHHLKKHTTSCVSA